MRQEVNMNSIHNGGNPVNLSVNATQARVHGRTDWAAK